MKTIYITNIFFSSYWSIENENYNKKKLELTIFQHYISNTQFDFICTFQDCSRQIQFSVKRQWSSRFQSFTVREGGKTQTLVCRFLFVSRLICIFNLSFTRFKIYLLIYISTYCMFVCYDCLFNFCSFRVHLSFNSQVFLFVLSLICIFNLSFIRKFIYSYLLVPVVCFVMIIYLIAVRFGFHVFFNSNLWSFWVWIIVGFYLF